MNLSLLNVGQQRHEHNISVRLLPRPSYSMGKHKRKRHAKSWRGKGKRKARLSRRKSKRAGKYGTKKRKERREEPLGTMSYQTSSKLSSSFWPLIGARKLLCFSALSEGRTAATVWNWSGKTWPRGSSRRSFLFFVPYFPACLDFLSPPLSAPRSPRMFRRLLHEKT